MNTKTICTRPETETQRSGLTPRSRLGVPFPTDAPFNTPTESTGTFVNNKDKTAALVGDVLKALDAVNRAMNEYAETKIGTLARFRAMAKLEAARAKYQEFTK